ncbi:MAG: hypothetical protein K0S20_243 [Patescibacteria group bacterium]|jgi:hypothetical protein|nr:hypothetical protein [Patescibacteria group bacterium]
MKTYFGFAVADGMFQGDALIERKVLTVDGAKALIEQGVEPCLNPSHQSTINAMRLRFDIDVPIPATPPRVLLEVGDSVLVMGVRGLPRFTDRHEYTDEEVASATFAFTLYSVKE